MAFCSQHGAAVENACGPPIVQDFNKEASCYGAPKAQEFIIVSTLQLDEQTQSIKLYCQCSELDFRTNKIATSTMTVTVITNCGNNNRTH